MEFLYLLVKVKHCRQVFVHLCGEDAGSLASSPFTHVAGYWLTGLRWFCFVVVEEGQQSQAALISCGL